MSVGYGARHLLLYCLLVVVLCSPACTHSRFIRSSSLSEITTHGEVVVDSTPITTIHGIIKRLVAEIGVENNTGGSGPPGSNCC